MVKGGSKIYDYKTQFFHDPENIHMEAGVAIISFPSAPARSFGVSISYWNEAFFAEQKNKLAGGVMWGYEGCKVTVRLIYEV